MNQTAAYIPVADIAENIEVKADNVAEHGSGDIPQPDGDQQQEHVASPRRWPAVLGALLTIAAWVLLFWSGFGSFCTAGEALVVSLFGIRGRLRNLAITSIVAASVLMLVFAIFEGLIFYMLRAV